MQLQICWDTISYRKVVIIVDIEKPFLICHATVYIWEGGSPLSGICITYIIKHTYDKVNSWGTTNEMSVLAHLLKCNIYAFSTINHRSTVMC